MLLQLIGLVTPTATQVNMMKQFKITFWRFKYFKGQLENKTNCVQVHLKAQEQRLTKRDSTMKP